MTIRNLDRMFRPASAAFVGASAREASVGGQVTRNLLEGGFSGDLYLVNPKGGAIGGHRAWTSLSDLPEAPDLVVIATPPDTIPGLIEEAAGKGAKAAVVITAGFGEGGDAAGKARGQAVLDAARPATLRVIGPNCVGLILPALGLNASFAPNIEGGLTPGGLAFASQSGAVLTAVLDWAQDRGIGFSHMISMGDMLDVDFGDVLDYLGRDPDTKAILLYIEAVTDARKFMSAARAVARGKPVIVMKAGRHAEGAKAATSHTGALAGSDRVYDAAFRRAGLVRVFTMDEMFDAVETLALAKRPRRDALAIVSNGGGFGVLATDTLIDKGGTLADLAPETIEKLDAVLPATWSRANPVDIIGDAPGSRYAAAMEALADDPAVGGLLVLNAPTALASGTDAATGVTESKAVKTLPILTSWLGGNRAEAARAHFRAAGIPTYETPSDGVAAFMHLVDYRRAQAALMETPSSVPDEAPPDRTAAEAVLGAAAAEGRSLLTEPEAKTVLAAYGIPVARTEVAADADAAVRLADAMGYPVALKLLSREITHKSDVGCVALSLGGPQAVRRAAAGILERAAERAPGKTIDGFAVQPMIRRPGAHELLLGASVDAQFGPVLLFGHGGTGAEAIDDTAIALPPLNMVLAREAMDRTRIIRLLRGYRDRPPAALDAIAATLVRLSRLIAEQPAVAELDINPLLADADGVIALDARVVLQPLTDGADPTRRFAIRPYPNELETPVELEGAAHIIRPVRPEDEPPLQECFARITPDQRRLRFFASTKALGHEAAARMTQIDYHREMALVLAEPGPAGTAPIFGLVQIICDPDFESAEYAVVVRSDLAGRGYGRLLMERIIAHCRQLGLREIWGHVLADNRAMLHLCDKLGFRREATDEPGQVIVRMNMEAGGG